LQTADFLLIVSELRFGNTSRPTNRAKFFALLLNSDAGEQPSNNCFLNFILKIIQMGNLVLITAYYAYP